ncbi:hypothetical protein AGMMS49592_1120 [Endomicrobiia bacterium]|nr:hypothetical protein AGMMS49592_1120 [Endomicrobiia bacterium]
MHHLGTGISEDAWYKDSDEEMRQIVARICQYDGQPADRPGKMLSGTEIVHLQLEFGIDKDNAKVRSINYSFTGGDIFKEVLLVYDQESENRGSESYFKGGNFHGFDYDRWAPTELGCCVYCKL